MIQVTLNYELLICVGYVITVDFGANHGYMMLNEPFESNYEDFHIHLIKHGLGVL